MLAGGDNGSHVRGKGLRTSGGAWISDAKSSMLGSVILSSRQNLVTRRIGDHRQLGNLWPPSEREFDACGLSLGRYEEESNREFAPRSCSTTSIFVRRDFLRDQLE